MQNKKNTKGFTLIEILVVILIIGITLGFAMIAFGDFGGKRRILVAAEQFVNYVKLVQQQAVLETSTLGIRINQDNYEVMRFQPTTNWQPMTKGFFHPQAFPDNTIVRMENFVTSKNNPQIIINASGDVTPFKLNFRSRDERSIANVIGEHNGTIGVQLSNSNE